jgi:hypothetical protein
MADPSSATARPLRRIHRSRPPLLGVGVWALVGWALASCATTPGATPVSPATRTLLDHSEAESILGAYQESVEREVVRLVRRPLTDDERAAIREGLSLATLMPIMERSFDAKGDPELTGEAARLVREGALGRVDSISEANPPSDGIDRFVARLRASPPPRERVELIARLARAQSAGDFFLLVGERAREAAHRIGGSLSPAVPPFQPLPEADRMEISEEYLNSITVSFLQQYEAVPDAELRAAVDEWSTPAGEWYVSAYSEALGETILVAADRIVEGM